MIDKFGNAFYLIIYLAHFIIVGSYAYQLVFDTKKFLKGRGVDKTATLITRFAGSFMVAIVLMAIYVAFIRSGGLEATWAFFNLIFIINVSILAVNFYTLKIDKTGLTKKLPKASENYPIIDRDNSWLHWRLMECPYKKDIYFFEYKNSFSIVHIYFVNKIKRLNILFTYSTEQYEEIRLYKLITSWAINNNIDYVWAVHKNQDFKSIFPKIHNKSLRFASWSSNSSIHSIMQNGFCDLQGIDSDIESAFYIE